MFDIIRKKKSGQALTSEEIEFVVQGYTRGLIPDYQMSAFLMAVYFKGMDRRETADFTNAMVRSGEVADLSGIEGIKVDKHSSGGVGDKLSLILIPLCASAGIPVAKMSGRGLGHTGGTIDKLESIPGFRTQLSREEFVSNVNRYKMALVGQSPNLAPADKKIYALRDVTDTVDSIPLIASSIMSKKIAAGADCIVLDVKVGSGAFMKTLDKAEELAETMVEIGKSLGRRTVAVLSNMNQPLGHEVGNANEVREAIEVLKGGGSEDEVVIALTIASYMTVLGGACSDFDEAYTKLDKILKSGAALEKFKEFVKIQGGNPEIVDRPEMLPQAKEHIEVKAKAQGFVAAINAEDIGIAAMLLGAGRQAKEDSIDAAAGITMVRKTGDQVREGDTLCILHTNFEKDSDSVKASVERAEKAFRIDTAKPEKEKLIYRVIE